MSHFHVSFTSCSLLKLDDTILLTISPSPSLVISTRYCLEREESYVSKLLSHQGYECHRFGGSSGRTSLDKHFFKFLHKPTTFPRLLKAVKLVQRDFTWEGIYVSPLTGKMVKHSYSTLIPGGVFQVSKELAEKYPFLLNLQNTRSPRLLSSMD